MAQSRHHSFRFRAETADRLERRSRETRQPKSRLVERYVSEGLRLDEHPQIVFREGAAGRRAALAGRRLDVWQVVETVRLNDNSVPEAAEYLSLPEASVRACLRYYAENKEEIDSYARASHEFAEREEAAWRREQEALA